MKHYKGPLGEFDYDEKLWCVNKDESGFEALHWWGGNQECNLPKGIIRCDYMFANRKLDNGFSFGEFDTSDVISMQGMFLNCKLPCDFTFGDKFDTSNVTNMLFMFKCCSIPPGVSLGDEFYVNSDTKVTRMFRGSYLSSSLDLGENFKPSMNNDSLCEFCYVDGEHKRIKSVREFLGLFSKEVVYDFTKLCDLRQSTLKFCKTIDDLVEVANKFCRV